MAGEKMTFTHNFKDGVNFVKTVHLRFVRRTEHLPEFYDPPTATFKVLQQMWQGSDGTQIWEDVPLEDEMET